MTASPQQTDRAVVPDEATATQVYRIVIRATPQQIWDAITQPQFSRRYFFGAAITVTPDGYESLGPDGSSWGDAPVYEWDPPHRLVHGWESGYDEETANEPASRVTWDIEPQSDTTCLLTVIHDRLEDAPITRAGVAGVGWMGVLSALKTVLETGEPLHERFGA